MIIHHADQLVLRLNADGLVIDSERAVSADGFKSAAVVLNTAAHACLHPHCADDACKLEACLVEALSRVDLERIVEWELSDMYPDVTVRLHMRRAGANARTWATLTVTDITEGRRAAGSLREVNRVLTEMIGRVEPHHGRQVTRLDRKLRNLTGELIVAQDKERRRIAAELHDGLGQWLSMAKLCLESGLANAGEGPATADLERAFAHLKTAIQEVRAIARNLRPSMLEEFGLVPTLELLCNEMQLTQPRMQVVCCIEGDPAKDSLPYNIALVRIMQEALTNVAKHSGATRLDVTVRFQSSATRLTVSDNGIGLGSGKSRRVGSSHGGIGMASMRERAQQSGGDMRVTSKARAGTTVSVLWKHPSRSTMRVSASR
jgi:signal transduction histidine kinase